MPITRPSDRIDEKVFAHEPDPSADYRLIVIKPKAENRE
jgi:hypothetical protein